MKSIDEETQVFIVRLWREVREIEGARPLLRGTVEHVPSGQRRSIRDLKSLVAFFLPYLEAMGVSTHGPNNCQGERQWLGRRRKRSD